MLVTITTTLFCCAVGASPDRQATCTGPMSRCLPWPVDFRAGAQLLPTAGDGLVTETLPTHQATLTTKPKGSVRQARFNRQTQRDADTAYMGKEQLDWLKEGLRKSKATWKIIAADGGCGEPTKRTPPHSTVAEVRSIPPNVESEDGGGQSSSAAAVRAKEEKDSGLFSIFPAGTRPGARTSRGTVRS